MKRRKNKHYNDTSVNVDAFDSRSIDATPPDPSAAELAVESEPAPEEPKRRQLIVVDLETTGRHDDAAILEVAAVNVDTGDKLYFVPHVTAESLGKAEPKAMQINRYYERGLFERALTRAATACEFRKLREMLDGNTFGGSNPTFDSRLVAAVQVAAAQFENPYCYGQSPEFGPGLRDQWASSNSYAFGRPWHHRLADLSAYTAGKLDIDLDDLPGLDTVARRLGVPQWGRHTAMGDAEVAAQCFKVLRTMNRSTGWLVEHYLTANLYAPLVKVTDGVL